MYENKAIINVAKKRKGYDGIERFYHLFNVSVDYYPECKDHEILKLIKEKFPEDEGYKVTETLWECKGKTVEE